MERRDNDIHAGTWAFLRCWPGIMLFVSVGIVCFVQNEILGGVGWMLAALWLFLFNVECIFFRALKDEFIKRLKMDNDNKKEGEKSK